MTSGVDSATAPQAHDRRAGWLVVVLTLVAAILRSKTAAASSAFWTDEAEFLAIARLPSVVHVLGFLSNHESHPPLFYLAERFWLRLFGSSDSVAVSLPLLCGVLLIPLAYVAGMRLFSVRTGIAAAILTAAGPFLAYFSAYARPYSALPLLALLSTLQLQLAIVLGGVRRWVLYAITTAAMLLTHNWAWLVFAAECSIVLGWLVVGPPTRRAKRIWPCLVTLVGVGFLFSPWLPAFLFQLRHTGHAGRQEWSLAEPFYPYLAFARVTLGLPAKLSAVLIFGLTSVAFFPPRAIARDPGHARLALWLCAGVPFVAVTTAGALSGRTWLTPEYCLLITTPLALVAIARGLDVLAERRSILGLLGSTTTIAVIYLLTWTGLEGVGKSNARDFALALHRATNASDLLLVHPGFVAPSLNYYLPTGSPQIDYPFLSRQAAFPYDRMSDRVADEETSQAVLDSLRIARRSYHRVWFITRCDWFELARAVPSQWVDRGLITSDVPILVTRFHKFRDELSRLYGPPSRPLPADQNPNREELCAELYSPAPAP